MKKYLLSFIFFIFFISCSKFEYSPFQTDINPLFSKLTKKNIHYANEIKLKEKLIMGIISDSHFDFDDLDKCVKALNKDDKIDLIIHLGDISEQGLKKSYEKTLLRLVTLNKPYFVIPGNHDLLSNGQELYEKIFGKTNFSIRINNYKLIFLDTNRWENRSKKIDFKWFEDELKSANKDQKIIVFAHIPPFSIQFDKYSKDKYIELTSKYKVLLSIHGHTHHYNEGYIFGTSVYYLNSNRVSQRKYIRLGVENETFKTSFHSF